MNYWMCSECNAVFEVETPAEVCPGCHRTCTFSNVTGYIAECGGADHLDRKLVAQHVSESGKRI